MRTGIARTRFAPWFPVASLLLLLPTCTPQVVAGQIPEVRPEEVVATIDGEPVTMAELTEASASALEAMELRHEQQLKKLDFDYRKGRHETLSTTLRNLVADQLFAREAEDRGVSTEALLAEEVESKIDVSEADVNRFYDENESRMQGRALSVIAPQIQQFLEEQERQAHRQVLLEALEAKNDVTYLMEPFRVEIETESHPARGPAEAPVTLIEFSDFECPYCDQFTATLQRLKEAYPDELRVVFRQFPLRSLHPNAQKAAEASLCAMDQGKFWEMHDLLFAERTALTVAQLKEKSQRLGLDGAAFDGCLDAGKYESRIEADLAAGLAAGVTGTPAIFINGQPMPSGALPYEQVAAAVDEALKRRNP